MPKGNSSAQDDEKITLERAKEKIQKEFYTDNKKEFQLIELNNDEIWNKMNTQLFRAESTEIINSTPT